MLTLSPFTLKGTPVTDNTDYSSRDKDARFTFYVLLWKRSGITLEQFDDYWRDVHGPVCARLPGQFQYWQFHVAHNEGGIFPAVEGVDDGTADEDQFDGIAELTFKTIEGPASLDDGRHHPDGRRAQPLQQGDRIRHRRGKLPDLRRPHRGRRPQRGLGVVKFHVMVRKADEVGVGDFRQYMTEQFAAAVVGSPHVLKFRLHLFEPRTSPGRTRLASRTAEPAEKQYQAAFEIGFRNRLEMEAFFASEAYAAAVKDLAKYVQKLAPFPERRRLHVRLRR